MKRALRFEGPDRVPFWWVGDPCDMTTDVARSPSATFTPLPDDELRRRVPGFHGELFQTEWGNIRGKLASRLSTVETVRSAFQSWDELAALRFPDLDAPERYETARARIAQAGNRYRFAWFGSFYFGTLYNIRKMEDLLLDLGLYQDELIAFCERLEPIFFGSLEQWKGAGAEGIMFGNDLGLQDRLLMSPQTWRAIFLPFHRRFYEKAHNLGLDVFMHSCGYIRDIIPDLVDAGLDCLQFDQIGIYDLDDLARTFGGKIAFFCPVDIQAVMPTGDRARIEAAAHELVQKLGAFNGGFLAKDYPQWDAVGVQPEWAAWMRGAFRAAGQSASAAAETVQ
ncbi:MAG: hypothetical protein JW951_08590 [Lentisphaerae bacterium]|nr:hypothetical protein [Lentisphaerota bacterium]